MIGLYFGTIDFSSIHYLFIIGVISLIICIVSVITFNILNNIGKTPVFELLSVIFCILGLISFFLIFNNILSKSCSIGDEQSKNNITKALNDKYENIENLEITNDSYYTGTFSYEDKGYKFYVMENTLYVQDITKKDNNITAISGKDY